jgi:hypothetical protein
MRKQGTAGEVDVALNIRLHKDRHGNSMCLITCDHQTPPRVVLNDEACLPTIADGRVFRCAMELRHQDPKKDPSVGCMGGYITPAGKITTTGRALMLDEGREGSPCDANPEIAVRAFDAIPGPVAVPNA